jgi:hypothetical protein
MVLRFPRPFRCPEYLEMMALSEAKSLHVPDILILDEEPLSRRE